MAASTLAEALPLLEWNPEAVVLDLMLPDGPGISILRKIRQEHLPIRVAVTTGTSDPSEIEQVLALRPDVYLSKPIDLRRLLEGLRV